MRKKLYESIDALQKDLDEWMEYYNNERTHQGKICCSRTPLKTLLDGKRIWTEKKLTQIYSDRHQLKTGGGQIGSELRHINRGQQDARHS